VVLGLIRWLGVGEGFLGFKDLWPFFLAGGGFLMEMVGNSLNILDVVKLTIDFAFIGVRGRKVCFIE
jgi:hypothetical protein